MYETNELNKLWLVCDNQKQHEFQKVVGKLKLEVNELNEKNTTLQKDLNTKTDELNLLKKEYESQKLLYENNAFSFKEVATKAESLELEKNYLLQMIEDKDKEIEKLLIFEIENAELKAKTLLDDIEPKKEESIFSKRNISSVLKDPEVLQNEEKLKISNINIII